MPTFVLEKHHMHACAHTAVKAHGHQMDFFFLWGGGGVLYSSASYLDRSIFFSQ